VSPNHGRVLAAQFSVGSGLPLVILAFRVRAVLLAISAL
jgi:hypothetical protein